MSEFGYLNHSSTDKRDEEAIAAMFAVLPCDRVTIEQLWSPGEKRRPAFELLLGQLKPGDTLFIHSIDRLGLGTAEIVRLWKTITREKQANIVVLDDPTLDTRGNRKPTVTQVKLAATRLNEALNPPPDPARKTYAAFRLVSTSSKTK